MAEAAAAVQSLRLASIGAGPGPSPPPLPMWMCAACHAASSGLEARHRCRAHAWGAWWSSRAIGSNLHELHLITDEVWRPLAAATPQHCFAWLPMWTRAVSSATSETRDTFASH